jgi:hypothetical protein
MSSTPGKRFTVTLQKGPDKGALIYADRKGGPWLNFER